MKRNVIRTVNTIAEIPGVGNVHVSFAICVAPGATYRATRAFEVQLNDRAKQLLADMAEDQATLGGRRSQGGR